MARGRGLQHLAELLEAEPVATAERHFEGILRGGQATLGFGCDGGLNNPNSWEIQTSTISYDIFVVLDLFKAMFYFPTIFNN